ncbi:hypothetical protein [Rickettsiella endosymbiont of Dermanyssus gallinae]|uniref:hypothetical protein n=1 Tax=Rickettsiella endosymbiont of Dermanyssus gallinae TaxID=2856608 RepID=UPI001C52FC19|nr:hypothetical protein [Rickettsiella endosymbiont of Dermanyssus gallinae]
MISLLIIFLIAISLFGTKRLRLMLEDLAVAIKNCNKTLGVQEDISLLRKLKSGKLDSDAG